MASVNEILKQIGWSTGLYFPIANEENKSLEAEMERLAIQNAKAKSSYEHATAQHEALTKHLKYVEQETEQNQKLITAHMQQVDDQRHKLRVSRAQKERINQEIRHLNRKFEDIQETQRLKKADLTKNMLKLEKLKAETEWDLGALEAWEASLRKRDTDNGLLKKFSKEDEYKANESEAKRQHLQMEVVNRNGLVEKMMAEITNYEQVIERADRIFKQQSEERDRLIGRWQDAVKNLHQRDADICRADREIVITEEVIARQLDALNDQNEFLKNEKNNNKLVEGEIGEMNLVSSLQRKQLNDVLQEALSFTNQVNAIKRQMYTCSQQLEKERRRGRNLDKEYSYLRAKLGKIETELDNIAIRLQEAYDSSLGAAERARSLEEIIDFEYKLTDNLVIDTEKTQCILYRSRIELNREKDISKMKEVQISGCEISMRMIAKRTKQTLNRLILQKEVVYALDYRISEMEVKIAELEGQRKDEEVLDAVNTRIAELENTLSEHTEVRNFLQAQVIRLEEEMRRLGISIAAENDLLETLRGKLQDQVLQVEGGVKQTAAAKFKSQHLQVEENVLRLKVSQINKSMTKEDKSIYDLHKFKIELETALKERQIEIGTQKEILFAEKKNLEESKGRLKADVKQRTIRIDQFKKKYHITIMTLGKDTDGQPLSITHFKILNAQEKYMLQVEQDELEAKLKKAEKEIIAMENTVKIVNVTNYNFRESMTAVGKDSDESKEVTRLECEIVKTNLSLRRVKKIVAKKQQHLAQLRGTLTALASRREEIGIELIGNQECYGLLRRGDDSRLEKLNRTNMQLKRLRKTVSGKDFEKPERNLQVQYLQDVNKTALKKFQNLHSEHEELSQAIEQYLSANNLKLPCLRTAASISSSSKASTPSYISSSSNSGGSTNSCLSQVILSFGI